MRRLRQFRSPVSETGKKMLAALIAVLLPSSGLAGLEWMFGDAGNCAFWIKPEDFARRDFSKVWGTIEGH